jgi:ribosome-binding protein aMBF1 (putative translation factor)
MFSKDLRNAIRKSGMSAWKIGQQIKTNPQTIRRFMREEVGLSHDITDRICELLDLTLVERGGPPPEAEPPDWDRQLEKRARELALEILGGGIDSYLRDRIQEWRLKP